MKTLLMLTLLISSSFSMAQDEAQDLNEEFMGWETKGVQHRGEWVCYYRNLSGQPFRAEDRIRSEADYKASKRCMRNSLRCRFEGCEYLD